MKQQRDEFRGMLLGTLGASLAAKLYQMQIVLDENLLAGKGGSKQNLDQNRIFNSASFFD